jgi:fermentation-respiration switch protein FrsA (DUF1100 family)
LLVHGTSDGTVPYGGSSAAYSRAPSPKALVTLINAPHTWFFAPWGDPGIGSTIDFFDGYLKRDRTAFKRLQTDANVAGVSSLTSELP